MFFFPFLKKKIHKRIFHHLDYKITKKKTHSHLFLISNIQLFNLVDFVTSVQWEWWPIVLPFFHGLDSPTDSILLLLNLSFIIPKLNS